VLLKLHHAAVDGDSMQRIMLAMHDLEPYPTTHREKEMGPPVRESMPGPLPLILKAYKHAMLRPLKLSKIAVQVARSSIRLRTDRKGGESINLPNATSQYFQGLISPHRTVTSVEFVFDEFKELRRAVPDSTVNDLALTVIAGALRKYLASKGEPLDKPLVAQVPVNFRSEAQQNQTDNQIGDFNVSCSSDIEDPLERLKTIHLATATAKRQLEVMGKSVKKDALDALGPLVSVAFNSMLQRSFKVPILAGTKYSGPNFTFSNMPASPITIYLEGAEYKWATALGPLLPNAGLFITANSSIGKFIFGITACRLMMPDPEFFQQCMIDSYDEAKTVLGPKIEKSRR
jgi:WS/DGAT/MGAT family acyltransferase